MSKDPVLPIQALEINQKSFTVCLKILRIGIATACGQNLSSKLQKMIWQMKKYITVKDAFAPIGDNIKFNFVEFDEIDEKLQSTKELDADSWMKDSGIEAIISEFSPGVFIQQKLMFLDTSKGVASNLCPHSADATEVHAFVVQAVSDMLEIVTLGILKGCGLSHKGINDVWKVLDLQLSWQLVMGKDVEMLKLAPLGVALCKKGSLIRTCSTVVVEV
ncbi:Endoribonuclease YBEY, chloroplastic [Sesamum angolense]|uniref:Endoribonuclease YBEY, chloroplastic n=1 Tax=Sesamum angolense TaxID=2727404 RepID=A0AAE1VZG9_9LAMI|nr:Endoribonuclease YBEY, chloroplastic [Sesamum angolense]